MQRRFLNGLLANAIEIEAVAVVAHFDYHLSALVKRVEKNCAARAFACGDAVFAGFDAVIDGVANKMGHGLGESVENAFVEISVFAGEFESNVFSAMLGNVADHAGETAKKLFDGNHANFKDRFVQFVEHARLERDCVNQFCVNRIARVLLTELGKRAVEHGFSNDQFADQIHHGVDARSVDAKSVFGNGRDSGTKCASLAGGGILSGLRDCGVNLRGLCVQQIAEQFVGYFGCLTWRSCFHERLCDNDRGNAAALFDLCEKNVCCQRGFNHFHVGSGGNVVFGTQRQ